MTPKSKFLSDESELAKKWLDVSDSSLFARASEVALLQMIENAEDTHDITKAAAFYHELIGARAALRTLRNLAVKPNVTRPQPDYELTGGAPKR
jgi:hypothetical protein